MMGPVNTNRSGWLMVAIAFLAWNFSLGVSAGSFGPVMAMFQRELNVSRTTISSTLGFFFVTLGLASPFVGQLLQRHSIRTAMITGASLSVAGYVLLACANSFLLVACAYALLLGPGACLMSFLPIATLITRWFTQNRGRALGIATMTLFLLIVPPSAAKLLLWGGRQLLFLIVAAGFIALIPILRQIRDWPAGSKQADSMSSVTIEKQEQADVTKESVPLASLIRDSRFWLLSVALGILAGEGTTFLTHIVAIATQKGIALMTAATLLSTYGLGTLLGSMGYGWLVDRLGPIPSLTFSAISLVIVWLGLALATSFFHLALISIAIGASAGAPAVFHGTAVGELYGTENVSRVMGFSYVLKVPFFLGLPPLTGLVFDLFGGYANAYPLNAGLIGISALSAGLLWAMTGGGALARQP